MNNTVILVNEWAAFEEGHPDAGIEEFCRYYLTCQRSKAEYGANFAGGAIPPHPRSFLMKLLAFLSKTSYVYYGKAFETIPEIRKQEDFYFLNSIKHKGICRKTDVVLAQLVEMTTGIDTLNRLLAGGLITEQPDPTDKRAKLVQLTEQGQEVLDRCYVVARRVNEHIFRDLSDDDIALCIQLLRGVEARQSVEVFELKDKTFDELLGNR